MRRNTYLAALLLLSPCIALAQSVPPPSVPPNAASWGYTTLAFNSDFTQRLPTNWLGGCPNGADGSQAKTSDDTGHVWWNNIWWSKSYAPCNVAQVYDPVYGGLVLDIPWTVDTATAYIGHSIQTASWDYNGGNVGAVGASFPNSAYYEFTARGSPVKPGAFYSLITWGVGGIYDQALAGTEWDIAEVDGNVPAGGTQGADAAVHNWGYGGAGAWIWTNSQLLAAIPNYDPTHYHTFGLGVASDGAQAFACGYVNNIWINCVALPNGFTSQESHQRLFLILSTTCDYWNYPNGCPLQGQVQHQYVKNVRVWVPCATWQTTQC